MSIPPPPPKPLSVLGGPPRMHVQRTGTRERGWMAWEAWVSDGCVRYAREYGTYAWSRKGAERKARRLLRKYERTRRPDPIEVQP